MSCIVNALSCTIFVLGRNAGGTMWSASSLLSTSTTIHALCSPSLHPQSAWLKKWDPLLRKTSTARAHATAASSCGTSMRNLALTSISSLLQPQRFSSLYRRWPAPTRQHKSIRVYLGLIIGQLTLQLIWRSAQGVTML